MNKIKSLEELVKIREDARREGKKVVFVNGYFQTLHPGHIKFLVDAKKHGDLLIVGVNSDKSVIDNKGINTSVEGELERAEIISAIESVDAVCIFDDLTPLKLINKLEPHILAKGDNVTVEDVIGKDLVESYGGRIVLLPFDQKYVSDEIVEAIHGPILQKFKRNWTLERDINEYLKQVDYYLDLAEIIGLKRKIISSEMKRFIRMSYKRRYVPPCTTAYSTQIYREFNNLSGNGDPYAQLKERSNEEASRVISKFSPRTFAERLKLAILGNIIDYGACLDGKHLNFDDVLNKFTQLDSLVIDHTSALERDIENLSGDGKKGKIFYLVDNSGEIIFDKFMLEYLRDKVGKDNLFIVGKEKPMQNDMTADDLRKIGYNLYGQIISTGSDCFGLHEDEVSDEFIDMFGTADLVIAKGQAYMEFFRMYDWRNAFNVLMIKFPMDVGPYKLPTMEGAVIDSRTYASQDGSGLIYPISELKEIKQKYRR